MSEIVDFDVSRIRAGLETEYCTAFYDSNNRFDETFFSNIIRYAQKIGFLHDNSHFGQRGGKLYLDIDRLEYSTPTATLCSSLDYNVGHFLAREALIGDRYLRLAVNEITKEFAKNRKTSVNQFIGTDVAAFDESWGYHLNIGLPKKLFGELDEDNPKAMQLASHCSSMMSWSGSGGIEANTRLQNQIGLSCCQKGRFVTYCFHTDTMQTKPIVNIRREHHGKAGDLRLHIVGLDRPTTPFMIETSVNCTMSVVYALTRNVELPYFLSPVEVIRHLGTSIDTSKKFQVNNGEMWSAPELQAEVLGILISKKSDLGLANSMISSLHSAYDMAISLVKEEPSDNIEWQFRNKIVDLVRIKNQNLSPDNKIRKLLLTHRQWSELGEGLAYKLMNKNQTWGFGSLSYEEYQRINTMSLDDLINLPPANLRAASRNNFLQYAGHPHLRGVHFRADWSYGVVLSEVTDSKKYLDFKSINDYTETTIEDLMLE